MARPKFVAGNWKMFTTRAEAKALAAAIVTGVKAKSHVEVAVCPPACWLADVGDIVRGSAVLLGGQNCYSELEGAFTGETSPLMLVELGCRSVIIGHSERRHGLNESDDLLAKKAKTALGAGLQVIFCVGELLGEREAGATDAVLHRQITTGLAHLSAAELRHVVVAYEPVWAIGTGKVATPEQAQSAHAHVRSVVRESHGESVADALVIQYGGSVKPDNARALMHLPDVDGALVGGASLKAETFLAIVAAAE